MALGLPLSCSELGSSVAVSFFLPLDSADGSLLDTSSNEVILRLQVALSHMVILKGGNPG